MGMGAMADWTGVQITLVVKWTKTKSKCGGAAIAGTPALLCRETAKFLEHHCSLCRQN